MSEPSKTKIKDAILQIDRGNYVLPGIQRKFVWKTNQIEMLFDSIMQDYPINSFMLWRVEDPEIRQNYKFYKFLRHYTEKFHEDNEDVANSLLVERGEPLWAVVDGQQRLTSLYIGLVGSYRYKLQSKRWVDSEENLPTRYLYLNLSHAAEGRTAQESNQRYEFKFKTPQEVQNAAEDYWFQVGKILELKDLSAVNAFLMREGLNENPFAMQTLTMLWSKIHLENLISYHEIEEQDQNKVLNIFIRTNSGGTELSFSDLLVSISAAYWRKYDIRKELSEVRKEIRQFGRPNFDVKQDFVLKALLTLSDCSVRFRIENFGEKNIAAFEQNWAEIRQSLVVTFQLLDQLGFNDSLLRAKNAAIPIAYYIYKHDLAGQITKTTYNRNDKQKIVEWLTLALLKGHFGGRSDEMLTNVREVLQKSQATEFPLAEIVEHFRGNADRNYSLDDDMIQNLLEEQYKTPTATLVLGLLYPDILLEHGANVAQDHMHPKTVFENAEKFAEVKFRPADEKSTAEQAREFAADKKHWNSVLNLQLLESGRNGSKNADSLSKWVDEYHKSAHDLLVDEGTSYKIEDFAAFIASRERNLKQRLKAILNLK